MAIDPTTGAPVLTKINQPTDAQSIALLKSIDSSLENIPALKIIMQDSKKNTEVTEDLNEELINLRQSITTLVDTRGLSDRDAKSYVENRKKTFLEQKENINDLVGQLRKSILSQVSISEADKSVLSNLGDIEGKFSESNEETNEELKKTNSFLKDELFPELKEGLTKLRDGIVTGILGPINLITEPIEDLFGFKFVDIFDKIFHKDDEDKKREYDRQFIKPRRSDMLKYNPETVYLGDLLTGKKTDKKEEDGKEMLGGLLGAMGLGGIASKLGPILGKVLPIAGIVASILMAVMDGLAGLKKAEDWGVTKSSAFIGGFLAGTGEGWKGAFQNSGKWAIAGVSAGFLAGGPVGALIGGLVGTAIGGILGFIGGKNVSKGIDKLKKWFSDFISSDFVSQFKNFFASSFGRLWDFAKDVFSNTKDIVLNKKSLWAGLGDIALSLFKTIGGLIEDFFYKSPIGKWLTMYIFNPIQNFFSMIGDFFGYFKNNNIIDIAKEIASGDFFVNQETFHKEQGKLRRNEKRDTLLDVYSKELDEFNYKKKLQDAGRSGGSQGIESTKNQALDFLIKKGLVDKNEVQSINDAIIHPSGKFFVPSPDDTIIATKSPVTAKPFDNDIDFDLQSLNKTFEQNFNGKEIVQALYELIDVTKNKKFISPIQTNSNIDFNSLRVVY